MATINAASSSAADVQSAINSASTGDTVQVPSGSSTWSTTVTLAKAIKLQGAGAGVTNITLSANFNITKQSAGIVRVKDFKFTTGINVPINIDGSWQSAEPIIITDCEFVTGEDAVMHVSVAGGLIFANNTSTGGQNGGVFNAKASGDTSSWTTADSMGSNDTTGKLNHYIEDNVFYGHSNGIIDADDNIRVVMRYNDFTYGGYNSHGKDTSPDGTRHFEIYNNTFNYIDTGADIGNVNWVIWVRGGTGIIANNVIDNVIGNWGDKAELWFSIRGAEDVRPQGSCAAVSYPVPHQLGQSHNGSAFFTDPIYLWGNTSGIGIKEDWNWGNPCGLTWEDFFLHGRDWINTGTAKPGWTGYTYPHPLRIEGGGVAAPTNFRLI